MANMKKLNTMTADSRVSVGSYGSIRKLMEAAALKGNAKERVLKCGKTYAAAGTDKREIRARLKAVLGDAMPTGRLTYAETETVSRGRKTGEKHFVVTVSAVTLKPETRKEFELVDAVPQTATPETDKHEPGFRDNKTPNGRAYKAIQTENEELRAENDALRRRIAEMAAALEMLAAAATK